MPRADIKTKQAVYTLSQLHAELAGKFLENSRQGVRLKTAMMQVEAVLLMLQPGFNIKSIAAKRRNKSNPWFKRGTLFRSAVDVMRRAGSPMTPREIATALSRQGRPGYPQAVMDLAIHAALRKREGVTVVSEGAPARWRLREAAN
jgi:hypothetical protein